MYTFLTLSRCAPIRPFVLVDSSGTPFNPHVSKKQFDVVIGEDGDPVRTDGKPLLQRPADVQRRLDQISNLREDAFTGWNTGLLNGYGNPGYRAGTFQNGATGIGTARDKTTWGNYWQPWRIFDSELLAMYNGNWISAKIIDEEPEEMFRNGWEVRSRDLDDKELKKLDDKASELRVNELLFEGTVWGRLFGGALNLLGCEDGREADEPLNEESIRTFHYLNVVDRRFVWVQRYYSDMLSPKFGLPEVYLITNVVSHSGMLGTSGPQPGQRLAAVSVHESRCIRFDGARSDVLTRQQLAGWTYSVLQRAYDQLRHFDNAMGSIDNLLADASQGVFKIKNLMEMISEGKKGDVISRMQLVDFGRSAARAILVDADSEDFERKPNSFAGLPELTDREMMLIAGAAKMPVTRLFGRSAAGMNATGEGDERIWLSKITTKRTNELAPKIKRVNRLMAAAKDSGINKTDAEFQIEFGQLFEPTEMEQADRELKVAQRDQIYLGEGVVTPEEVKLGRFGSGKFSSWVDVDADALQKAVKGAVKFDPYANEPVPEGANVNAAQQGESQSPVVPLPLPGSPDLPPTKSNAAESPQRTTEKKKDSWVELAEKLGRARDSRSDSAAIAPAVHHQLQQDYPDDAIAWVLSAEWKGPKRVSLEKIDFSNAESWQASHDPVHVDVMTTRIESGIEKPLILVKVPHSKMLKVIDGHHRVTAYKKLDKNPKAYVATVNATTGPWDEMHSAQKDGLLGSNQKQGGE